MIKDKINNSNIYYSLSEALKIGFEWIKSNDLKNITPDKYEIQGNNIYANVQCYNTKDNPDEIDYEAHRKYIDIQYMISGSERIGICNINNCTVTDKYNTENDVEFLKNNTKDEWLVLNEGEFVVLFPEDAHKPTISNNNCINVKKAVVKVAIN